MKYLVLLFLLPFYCLAQLRVAGLGPGGVDTSAPGIFITTSAVSPVIGTTGVTTVSYTFTGTKVLVGFTSGDVTLTNATILNFTGSGAIYTADIKPASNGSFGAQVLAGVCTDTRGTANTASNNLLLTFSDDSGFTYDLQNATSIIKSEHYRCHAYSVTDCSDLISTGYLTSGEMLLSKYNLGATMYANSTSSSQQDIYKFGRLDFGCLTQGPSNSGKYWTDLDPLVTTTRQGNSPDVGGYKNGDDSYKTDMLTHALYIRNSKYESTSQTLPTTYAGLVDTDLISRGVTFRWDYYGESATGTNWYLCGLSATGCQALGESRLTTYVNTVISSNGWFSNFVHWPWFAADYPEHYYEKLTALINSTDGFRGTTNIAAEYYFVKEAVTSISGSGSTVTINYSKDWPSSPYNKILTPLWIKVNLTGTGYAGHGITTSHGGKIRSFGGNVYGISIPLDFTQTSTSFHIYITPSPSYVNLNVPIASRLGNVITVDQSTMMSVYKIAKPTSLTTSVTSLTIPTSAGTVYTLTVATGLTVVVNSTIKLTNDASHLFFGIVTSYNSGTGSLVIRSSSGIHDIGSGTFSSWTIQNYNHYITATLVERDLNYSTSHTIAATLDTSNFTYQIALINSENISSVLEF